MSDKTDRISNDLNNAADIADGFNQSGIKTGKASWWIRLGANVANAAGAIASLFKRK